MRLQPIRRVITGHDSRGKAIITEDGPLPTVVPLEGIPGTSFHELWATAGAPAPIDNGEDPTLRPLSLAPPRHGTRIRVVDIPPDTEDFIRHGAGRMRDTFAHLGNADASTVAAHSPHPLMHRTESVDYGVVLEGEIVLVLDDSEVALRQGDVVIQRGTNHAWANRSGQVTRMLFILVDGAYEPTLRHALDAQRIDS